MAETVIRYSNDGLSLENVPAISEITIKSSATSIKGIGSGAYAFFNAKDTIRNVYFEKNSQMESVSPYCFYCCKFLSSVDFSFCSKITSIGDYAFSNCNNLKTLKLPDTVTTIGSNVFQFSGLVSISLPASVENFGKSNFFLCESLVSFKIDPNSPMTFLSDHQFTSTKLVSLKLTKTIQFFSGDNFEGVSTIETLQVDPANPYLVSVDNVIFTHDMKTLLYSAPAKIGTYEVPYGVETINNCAFYLSSITGITFPETLQTIRGWTFIRSKIKSLSFPSNVLYVQTRAFYSCEDLSTVTFSEGIKEIGENCFMGCNKLTKVDIPKSLVRFGGGAFSVTTEFTLNPDANFKKTDNGQFIISKDGTIVVCCISENQILSIPYTVTTIDSHLFYGIKTIKKLEIPENSVLTSIETVAFKESSIEEINLPETVRYIQLEAFRECTHLKSIHISRDLYYIGVNAFYKCTELGTVTVSDGVGIEIDVSAFYGCSNLMCDSFNGRLITIKEDSFRGCSKLTSLGFNDNINTIGNNAFQETGLTSVTFPSSITMKVLPIRCFYKCTHLSTFNLPEGLETIMDEAFAYTSIAAIVLPKSITTLSDGCFQYCYKLTTLTIPPESKLSKIGFGVFYNCILFESIDNSCDNFDIYNDALFDKNKTELFVLPPKSKCKHFSFPSTLKKVGISALQGCHNIEVIFLPSNVTEIMPYAFSECTNLRSINIPINCEKIGPFAFKDCNKVQCGISIENQDSAFRQSLVTTCGLPITAIYDCANKCFTFNKYNFNAFSFIFSLSLLVLF